MPGDGTSHDKMYMSFRLQYLDSAGKHWVDLASGDDARASSTVGPAGSARQGGRSFQLVPVAGKPAATLRGRGRLPVAPRQDGPAVGQPAHDRRAQEPRRRRPGGLQRRQLPDRLNSRGSLVMIPSTPIAVSRSIVRASSTVHT